MYGAVSKFCNTICMVLPLVKVLLPPPPIWVSLDLDFTTADVDPKILARATPGFSGADLQNMIKWVTLHSPPNLFRVSKYTCSPVKQLSRPRNSTLKKLILVTLNGLGYVEFAKNSQSTHILIDTSLYLSGPDSYGRGKEEPVS